jgi:hypothetical protein
MKTIFILCVLLIAAGCQDRSITPEAVSTTEQHYPMLTPSQAALILTTHAADAGLSQHGIDILGVAHVACTPQGVTSNELQQVVDLASPDFQRYGWQCTLVPRKGWKGRDAGFRIEAFKKTD